MNVFDYLGLSTGGGIRLNCSLASYLARFVRFFLSICPIHLRSKTLFDKVAEKRRSKKLKQQQPQPDGLPEKGIKKPPASQTDVAAAAVIELQVCATIIKSLLRRREKKTFLWWRCR